MDIFKACQTGFLERIKEIVQENLLKNGGKMNYEVLSQPDSEGITPLHWAALNGRLEVCKYLLDRGVFVDALGGDQAAPAIHWAICKGQVAIISHFIRFGADWRVTDQQGYNSMHVAAQNGHEMIILLLKAYGADINSLDRCGRTPLLWASYRGHGPAVEILIKNGAWLDQADENGRTPLHWAVIKGNAVCAAKLLKNGAALDVRDIEGKLPADWAKLKQVSWFDRLHRITLDYKKSQSKPRNKTFEFIGTVLIPCLITPILISSFTLIATWWWSTLIASTTIFLLYNLSAQILIPNDAALPETSFLSFYNYSTLFIINLLTFGVLIPNQIGQNFALSCLCAVFALTNARSLYKLRSADPGKLALPRSDSERDQTICQLAHDGHLDKRRFCVTCSIRKPLRSKHCKTCDRCVGKFDHHCPWINNCVGFHNHRTFMVYLYSSIGFAFTFLPLAWNYFHHGIKTDGIQRASSCFLLSDQMCKASSVAPVMFWIFNFSAFMTFWLLILTVTQTFQIFRNLTTNEMSNYVRLEYFYPQLQAEDVPFENIKDCDRSKRYFNVFDYGIISNWLDFWKHPLTRRHNLNVMPDFTEEDLRQARIKKLKKKSLAKHHERSISATSVPLIKNLLNTLSPKRECCSGHDHKSPIHPNHPSIQSNSSKQHLLEGLNMV